MNLVRIPLVKVTIGFISGLLLGFIFSPSLGVGIGALLFGVLLLILIYTIFDKINKMSILIGIFVFITSLLIGAFNWVIHDDVLNQNHYLHSVSTQAQLVHVTLDTKLKPTANNYRFYAQVSSNDNRPSSGKILVNLNKKVYSTEPEIGSSFLIYNRIIPNQNPKNPYQFDYGRYLEKQKVYGQLFTDSINSKKVGTHKTLNYYTAKVRQKIIFNLEKSEFSSKELSVLHALLLGQQQDISPDIIQAYQYAGAVHILSVSGLHVAYIYLFLNFVLKFIPNYRQGRLLKLIILIGCLWSFALLAGMAPAIVRAVTMFSFVSLGKYIRRHSSTLYSLIISMLFILLWNPAFLFDVGFQLSYLALYFIVWVKPMFDKLYRPTHKVKKYIWDVATVSLAAQIGVLPLSLYYFNQFPTLFIITNLFVLFPLSFVMIYGIVIAVLALMGVTNFYLSKILEYGIWYINQVSIEVAKFEEFVLKDIPFTSGMLIASYLFIFAFFQWFKSKKYQSLVVALSGVILFQLSLIYQKKQTLESSEFVIFYKSKSTLLAYRESDEIKLFSKDSISTKDPLIKSYKIGSFASITSADSLQNFFYLNGNKIMIIDTSGVYNPSLQPDILLLCGSAKINLERLLQQHKPSIIVADASNYKSYVELWKYTCEKHNVAFHSTYENSFFSIESNK